MPTSQHPAWTLPFRDRALLPETSPLTAYLLRLITIKRSNLCLSADVTSTSELLAVAEEVGDSICLLKTHADIINDFSDRTVRGLREIAKRKKFLVFEDRKFGDIGSTVQKQYTAGPLSIAKWAEITNAHIFPGPAIVKALREAAADSIAAYNTHVCTEITGPSGLPPRTSRSYDDAEDDSPVIEEPEPEPEQPLTDSSPTTVVVTGTHLQAPTPHHPDGRKPSIVSVSTTIHMQTEPISPQPTPFLDVSDADGRSSSDDRDTVFERLGSTPFLRALLLLAEMSSEGHLMTGDYTAKCVEIARQYKDFVMGFIAQRSLNQREGDNFITMTPGCSLPPPGHDGGAMGDGLGQQYNTPRKLVLEQGCDVVIVGRGILKAEDRGAEAERYRKEAWEAYEERIGLKG
ncbi:hypothetical protein LTS18_003126 [Coniosporium uncinatum]|uniref:Uncharacterized protein n=1 Tax=Coniosporium uncinatum TaxID=93489 RepID=A0ACC3DTJ0_9PEZI|nr:hypothetical protein LTS18_003126 [Coniosporium uncinatum]